MIPPFKPKRFGFVCFYFIMTVKCCQYRNLKIKFYMQLLLSRELFCFETISKFTKLLAFSRNRVKIITKPNNKSIGDTFNEAEKPETKYLFTRLFLQN